VRIEFPRKDGSHCDISAAIGLGFAQLGAGDALLANAKAYRTRLARVAESIERHERGGDDTPEERMHRFLRLQTSQSTR